MGIYPGGVNIYEAQANPPEDANRCCAECGRLRGPFGAPEAEFYRCDYRYITEPKTDVCEHWLWIAPW